ncbi:nitroreductase family protein, partial [Halorussus sp. GCM10023401]
RSRAPGPPSKGSERSRWSWRRKWVGSERAWNVPEAAFPVEGSMEEKARHLLRYAVLAPSSHNTQPWLFTVSDDRVEVYADRDRWLTVADPDKRELFLSVGAALENLLVAAEHFGMGHDVEYFPGSESNHAATVTLSERDRSDDTDESTSARESASAHESASPNESSPRDSRLFDAIPRRRTNSGRYQERTIPREDLRALRELCVEEDIAVQFVTDPADKGAVADLVERATRRQFADPAYRRELARWVGRGAFGDSFPEAKVGKVLLRYLNVGRQQGRSDAALVRDSPVLVVIRTVGDRRTAWVRAGQVFERASLLATVLGLQTHPMSAPLEEPALRRELSDLLGAADDGREWPPQHLFRLGYGKTIAEPSPRRSPEAMLLD